MSVRIPARPAGYTEPIPLLAQTRTSSSREARSARFINQIQITKNPNRRFSRPPLDFPRFVRASSSSTSQVPLLPFAVSLSLLSSGFGGQQEPKSYRGPKPSKNLVADFVSRNDDSVRSLPIYVGGASLLAVLFNRAVSVWLSIRPKTITPVEPEGVDCKVLEPNLPASILSELLWAWESIKVATCCKSLVIVYNGICLLQIGMAAKSPDANKAVLVNTDKLMTGSVYQGVFKSKARQKLLGKSFSISWEIRATISASKYTGILRIPLGDKGIAVIGGNTIRGFTSSDQASMDFFNWGEARCDTGEMFS
ncbi:hypothetical protein HID58_043040 [Brassica napus]|uniref:Uncharacterized protein n=1 Tax=Brassica napus TaxID=3708 RepID=A0ABQ8BFC0_BRANA|nr:hypothetical protein HID58_043037 [Brassica napus]KAH0903537.1 hypothetical protein HID58_043040 [Brassica napus]